MPDETAPQNVQMRINDSQMRTTYANAFRQQSSAQEVILDFGINVVTPANAPGANGQQQMNVHIDNRLVMNYVTTKRLAIMLSQIVQSYEQKNGVINVEPQQA